MIPSSKDAYTDGIAIFRILGTPEEVRNKIRDFKTKAPKQTPQTHFKHNKPQFITIWYYIYS